MEGKGICFGKKVLILGAAGSVGSSLSKKILRQGVEKLMLFDNNESGLFDLEEELIFSSGGNEGKIEMRVGDIRDNDSLKSVFEDFRPDIVYHAAAYKHIHLMEKFYAEAVKNNILGTYNVLKICKELGVQRFVFISTDKAVNPVSIMGMSKRIGELLVKSIGGERYVSVRFGNVERSRGSVIPLFEKQIERGGPVTITDENMERYFISNDGACELIFKATELADNREVFVLDMGNPKRIVDIAREMIINSGKDVEVKIIGKRAGERLGEELFSHDELRRINGDILVLKNGEFDGDLFLGNVEGLFREIGKMDYVQCKKELLRICELGRVLRKEG